MDSPIRNSKETLNPYKLTVAVLIREYLRLRRDLSPESIFIKFTLGSREKERDDCKVYLLKNDVDPEKLVCSAREVFDTVRILQHMVRSQERDVISLISLVRRVLVKPHLLLFRRAMEIFRKDDYEETSRYIEMNFPSATQTLKADTTICALFLRKIKLLYDEMNYSAHNRFSSHLLDYIRPGFRYLDEKMPPFCTASGTTDELFGKTRITAMQANLFLEKEAGLMVRNSVIAGDGRHMGNHLKYVMLSPHSTHDRATYLHFLESFRMKDYGQALMALKKFVTLRVYADERPVDSACVFHLGEASLQQCVMHHNAGHYDLAVKSLKECIFLAQQEKGDVHLLSNAMYWLACLEINNNQYEKLYRGACAGDFVKLPEVAAQFAALISRFDGLLGADVKKVTSDLDYVEQTDDTLSRVGVIQQYSARASFWKLYGFDEIAVTYSQACVQTFARPENGTFPVATDSLAICASFLLEQAVRFSDRNSTEALLAYCQKVFPAGRLTEWQNWALVELVWKYRQTFNEQNYHLCEVMVEHISKLNPVEASLRKAELLYANEHRPKRALELLSAMLTSCDEASAHISHLNSASVNLKVRLLLLKAEVFMKSECGLEALKCVMEALALTAENPNSLWRAKVQLQVGYVWLQLQEIGPAKAALALCFQVLSGCRFAFDEGRAWYLKAMLLWFEKDAHRRDADWAEEILNCFEKALESFFRCSAVQNMLSCLFIMTWTYEETGNSVKRDHFSGLFMRLLDRYPWVAIPDVDV